MKNLNKAQTNFIVIFALSILAFIPAIHSQTNYYTTGMGQWTFSWNWSPSYPGEIIAAGDTVFVQHFVSNNTTSGITINGVLVIESSGIVIGNQNITTNSSGEIINRGALALSEQIHNYGNLYNSNWISSDYMYIEGYLCNSGTISISDGEIMDLYGGTVECGGTLLTDEIRVENDGAEVAVLRDLNICRGDGDDPIIDKVSGTVDTATIEVCGRALPVELYTYSVKLEDNQVRIDWSTATEIDNDYFVVERSSDGYSFEEFARVEGSGNSTSIRNYGISDEFPFEGVSYYRLRQVDFDGKMTFFDIKTVENKNGYVDKNGITVFPNPIMEHSKFEIGLEGFGGEIVQIKIQNMNGFLIYSNEIEIEQQRQLIELETNILNDSGMYIVSVFNDNKWNHHKFMFIK